MTSKTADILEGEKDAPGQAGARVLTGGKPVDRPGSFYASTVLTNIPKDSPA
jgi:succinate-semialdehyde dehydrogenase/glutarate-semialdehyde dehydrogenase